VNPFDEPRALFVYGTLLFPEVVRALLGRVPDGEPAAAPGWRAAALPGRVYPGLVPDRSSADGLLLTGLTDREWWTLDAYEDGGYDLRRLTLTGGRQGWAYVWVGEPAGFPRSWDPEEFAARHLAGYVEDCVAWRRRLP
jgi:gamma-glutamylcyclotransferase (GGCT)/AIG2-like uncharacterized protein YtfP